MSKVKEKLPGCHFITVVSFWKRLHKDFRMWKICEGLLQTQTDTQPVAPLVKEDLHICRWKLQSKMKKSSITFAFSHWTVCCGADELS